VKPRYTLFIVAVLVGKRGAMLWDVYFPIAQDGAALPNDEPMPPDIVECQRIWVECVWPALCRSSTAYMSPFVKEVLRG
jgi:hypothetical protein